MKNKLLTSIIAVMLALVAGVSAFDAGSFAVSPSPLALDEDATGSVTFSITSGDGTETLSPSFGTHLQDISASLTRVDNDTWTMDVKPVANYNGPASLEATINDGLADEETVTLTVNISPVNDAPTITSTPATTQAVEGHMFSYDVNAADADSTPLTFSLTTKPTGMTINPATGEIAWTPDDDQLGERTVVVAVSDNAEPTHGVATQEFTITARPKEVCENGCVGDLDIDVQEPDNHDEYTAGEEIDIDVQVENKGEDDLDVTVKAMLFDLDQGKLMATAKVEQEIDDGDEENFDLVLKVPTTDWNEDNEFMLYVVAYEDDDDHCAYNAVPIDLEREQDDVAITGLELTPAETAAGKTVTATVTVENIGEDDQDNVYVKLRNSYLELVEESASFDIDDYKSDDNENTVTFTFEVPEGAEAKEYWIEAVAYFDKATQEESEVAVLTVTGKPAAKEPADTEIPSLEIVPAASLSAETGEKLAVPVVVNNAGNAKASFTVEVSSTEGWAEVLAIEQPDSLNAGESGHAYIYLEIKDEAAIGVHEFSLNLRSDAGLLATKKVAVTVEGQTADITADDTASNKVTGLFTAENTATNVFYAAGAVVLVLVGLFFLRMLFKK